jgi:zinc and cadmium transporter
VVVAASLTISVLTRVVRDLVSLSAGVLLGTALLNVLPEAVREQRQPAQPVRDAARRADVLLPAREGRALPPPAPSRGDEHHHHHGFDRAQAGRGGWSVLMGDSIHNFCDGIIIAAAFLTDLRLGTVTALAIIAHEIPQEVGDYIVLLNAGLSRRKALLYNAASGLAAVAGGVIGYFIVGPWKGLFPVPAGDRVEQLRLRGGGGPDPAAATPAVDEGHRRALAWLAGGLTIVVMATSSLHHH